jgi:Ca-activated chloride channel homolog
MTDLDIDWGNLKVSDIFPRKLPDMFRGTQLTVLGRYSGTGSFPVTLKGKIRNETRALKYDKNEFPNITTSNDFLPRIWAMRKVGYLLDEIRMSGVNAESKNQIVKLAKKYGFVTPYTSYLAAEESAKITSRPPATGRIVMPADESYSAIASAEMPFNMSLPLGDLTMPPASGSGGGVGSGGGIGAGLGSGVGGGIDGFGSFGGGYGGGLGKSSPSLKKQVEASVALQGMKSAEVAASPNKTASQRIGAKEFALKDNVWTDTTYDPKKKLEVVDLVFGSEALLKAMAADKQLAAYAALGKSVTVVHNGKVYRIHP